MDYISTRSKLDFVLTQLSQYPGLTKQGSGSTFVVCPFHAEKTPSGRIFHSETSKSPGFYKCYGCGKTETWDKVAPLLGLKPFKQPKPSVEYANLNLIPEGVPEPEESQGFVDEDMELYDLPRNKAWRDVKTNLLIELGAKKCRIRHPEFGLLKPKLWLPVYMNGDLKGYLKARFKKHPDHPSYINAKGQWSKTHGLFPYDYAIKLARKLKSKTIVLVEGPRDALRLLQMGIPAVCILGTQSWTATKGKMLEIGGIERVILMMDGDCAGREATKLLEPKLRHLFEVQVIRLWSIKGSPYIQFKNKDEPSKAAKRKGVALWDPGNAPEWIIKKIKSKFF